MAAIPDYLPARVTAPFRRVLITGGSGFVGSYLHAELSALLPGTDLLFTRHKGPAVAEISWVGLDLTDGNAVMALINEYRPDLVVHLAAQSSPGSAASASGMTWRVNVGGAIALAEALARHARNVTLLNISSSEVYGQSFLAGPVNEEAELRPVSVYGRTKAVAESVFADILPDTAKLITARSFNHTGPGQDERFVVPSLASQLAQIEQGELPPPLRVGNLDSQRDFLDVRDVARAYAGLIAHATALPMRSTFNIATGKAVPISEVLSRLLAMTSEDIPVEQDLGRLRKSDIPCAVGDASAIHAAIGWTPQIDMDQMLRDVLEAMRMRCSAVNLTPNDTNHPV